MRGHGSQWISHEIIIRHPGRLKKNENLGAVLELPAKQPKQHYQSSPFTSRLGQISQIGSAV